MQHWDLLAIDAARGTRDPYVVHQDDGTRAVLVVLAQLLARREHDEQLELGPGGLMRFEPGERHAISSANGARILLLLSPWPGAGHYPA